MGELSNFKRMVQDDISTIFINLAEFGEVHIVDGWGTNIIIAPDQRIPMGKGYEFDVSESSIVIYVSAADFERKESGQNLNIDGIEYVIDRFNSNMGIYEIFLSQTRVI